MRKYKTQHVNSKRVISLDDVSV